MIKCQFENGNQALLRHVTIDAIVLNKTRDKILLVKRAPNLTNPNKYALPGGYLERDEDTASAVLRETLEETGYKIKIIALFRVNDNPNRPKEDRQNVDFIYLTEAVEKVKSPDKETSKIKWFEINNLPPEDEFAFDHLENIKFYLKYLKQPFNFPFVEE